MYLLTGFNVQFQIYIEHIYCAMYYLLFSIIL